MPTRVRSIWQRKPEPIPPPVVCRTEPIPLVQAAGVIHATFLEQTIARDPTQEVLSAVQFTFVSLPGWSSESVKAYSSSYASVILPAPIFDTEEDEESEAPAIPVTEMTFERNQPRIAWFATPRYDDVVKLTLRTTSAVFYNLYVDLGKASRGNERYYG